jgi:hypothetical protein
MASMPPVFALDNRLAIRSESNPYDKATVFSIYPVEIEERKLTIQPGVFKIPAGTYENPGRLIVGPSSWWRDVDPEQPLLEIPVSAIQVADSIVKDYCQARVGSDMSSAMPGLFYLPGQIGIEELKKKPEYRTLLDNAQARQKNWFATLVKLGDALWARCNGNPVAIDDSMKLACKELGMSRDWVNNYKALDMIQCVACGNLRNPLFPICPHCKAVVDVKRAEELQLTFAK